MTEGTDSDLRARLERRIDDLPVLPTVVAKLFTLDPDDEGYFEELLALVEADATFAARSLSAANAAASSPSHPVETVRGALARLGSQGVRSLVMSLAVARVFIPRDPWEASLWRHTLQTATAARRLSALSTDEVVSGDVAYAAGLLHDVGRFVMFAEAPDTLRAVDEGDWASPTELVDFERSICGLTHAEIGVLACRRWGLPPVIESVVGWHHEPTVDLDTTEHVGAALALLRFADLVMFPSAIPGTPGLAEASVADIDERVMPRSPTWLRVDAGGLKEIVAETTEETDTTLSALGIG